MFTMGFKTLLAATKTTSIDSPQQDTICFPTSEELRKDFMEFKFKIEQVALAPTDADKAIELLRAMGMDEWAHDIVVARGVVGNMRGDEPISMAENVAHLAFNYQALDNAKELEVLNYSAGANWLDSRGPCVSHLGMHVEAGDLIAWKEFFRRRGIPVVQEVDTLTHSNPVIAGKRWYKYVIFGTHHILGVDLKFIVRKEKL